ncbi:MAG: ketol-acid reductoisomerase [Candidatus Marinimicrobia bacterium]|nr:ketol-acid reductoisomerase [Candidatus Neomarinimicrobiota bacterium]
MKNQKIYYNEDADLNLVKSKTVLVVGYGNQGRAQSKNLFDSGVNVLVGLRENSDSIKKVKQDGLNPIEISLGVKKADIISILIPDQTINKVFCEKIAPFLNPDHTLLFSHGYNIYYKKIIPPLNVNIIMVAPSGAGLIVRKAFKKNSGVPNLIAIHQDYSRNSLKLALSYSKAIGGTRAGSFLSTFKEETESDLFGEQAVLCGGIPALIKMAFDVMVESGFQPIVAWYVCFYEVKLIVDVFHRNGFKYMYNSISETAEYGGLKQGDSIINEDVRHKLQTILKDIQTKKFFNEFEKDANNNFVKLNEMRKIKFESLFEKVTQSLK